MVTALKAKPSFAIVTDENTPARFHSERAGEDFSAMTRGLAALRYTSLTFLSGRLRTGFPVAA
jgi:hypothetical protein